MFIAVHTLIVVYILNRVSLNLELDKNLHKNQLLTRYVGVCRSEGI